MVNPVQEYFDIFSGRDVIYRSLDAAAVTGLGRSWLSTKPRRVVSMQVSFDGPGATVKILLEGTIDGINWGTLATFDTGAGSVSGDIVTGNTHAVLGVRANAITLSAGKVTAVITGTSLGS